MTRDDKADGPTMVVFLLFAMLAVVPTLADPGSSSNGSNIAAPSYSAVHANTDLWFVLDNVGTADGAISIILDGLDNTASTALVRIQLRDDVGDVLDGTFAGHLLMNRSMIFADTAGESLEVGPHFETVFGELFTLLPERLEATFSVPPGRSFLLIGLEHARADVDVSLAPGGSDVVLGDPVVDPHLWRWLWTQAPGDWTETTQLFTIAGGAVVASTLEPVRHPYNLVWATPLGSHGHLALEDAAGHTCEAGWTGPFGKIVGLAFAAGGDLGASGLTLEHVPPVVAMPTIALEIFDLPNIASAVPTYCTIL